MPTSRKALKCWSITLGQNFKPLPSSMRVVDIFTEMPFTNWCFQLEEGKRAGKEHFQCRAMIDPPQQTATLLHLFESRGFDKRDVTCSPESNKSIEQGGLSFYVMKDDTRKEGPWYDSTWKVKKRHVYEGKDLECMKVPLPFQAQVIAKVNTPPDDRRIHWVYNPKGCGGKSKLMKWFRFNDPDVARVGLGSATQIKTSIIAKGPHRAYMVDLPRVRGTDEKQQELFSALEEIKNGWVESPMYGKADELLMEPPHVWVFSNELPTLSHCTLDRWAVWELSGEMASAELRELTLNEVRKLAANDEGDGNEPQRPRRATKRLPNASGGSSARSVRPRSAEA